MTTLSKKPVVVLLSTVLFLAACAPPPGEHGTMSSYGLQVQEDGSLVYQDESSSVGDPAGETEGLEALTSPDNEMLEIFAAKPKATPQPINRPFGSKPQAYASGTIRPNHIQADKKNSVAAKLNDVVKGFYDKWKKAYVVRPCDSTTQYVVKGGQNGLLAVSEGQGYGMLITVLMAGYDSKAKEIFDGIHKFARSKGSTTNTNLMAWAIDSNCKIADPYPAADGDLDMALALLMADKQWGSNGAINYLDEAKKTINAIKSNLISEEKFIKAGPAGLTRTSDMVIGHFRAFKTATNDQIWAEVINKSFNLLNKVVSSYAGSTGLHPDFIKDANTDNPSPPTTKMIESETEGYYAWNACRNPWRFATDFAMSSDSRSKNLTQKIIKLFRTNTYKGKNAKGKFTYDIGKIYTVYKLDGTPLGYYNNMAFQAPIGVGAIVDSANQDFLNAMWDMMASKGLQGYYPDSIRLISLIVMSGNWWRP